MLGHPETSALADHSLKLNHNVLFTSTEGFFLRSPLLVKCLEVLEIRVDVKVKERCGAAIKLLIGAAIQLLIYDLGID